MGSLEPLPGRDWPSPEEAEDLDADLNQADGPGWLDEAAQAARRILQASQDQLVVGHCDWMTDNLRWNGSRLLVAYDWDSLIADSEAVIAGLAAAIYLYPALPTTAETRAFLDAYASACGRPFTPGELRRCWAAGVWTRASTPNRSTPPESQSPADPRRSPRAPAPGRNALNRRYRAAGQRSPSMEAPWRPETSHPTRIGDPGQPVEPSHGHRHLGKDLHPRPGAIDS